MATPASPATPRRSWIDVQKRTFSGWANNYLKERIMRIKDFDKDLKDGINFINLLEIISAKKLPKYNHNPKTRFQQIENISIGIKFIQSQGIKLVGIGGEDVVDGNVKLTLGLLWTLILRYQISTIDADGYESPKAALLAWCKKRLAPYNIQVYDFDQSWQDGRALCALTDSLKVGLLPLSTLSQDPLTNATRAMNLAEENFDIPQILDPYDLVTIPDDLSIMTYLSYFRDYVVNAEKKADEDRAREEERKKKTADVSQVFARGSGVEEEGLYAHQTAKFNIQAVNFFGEDLRSGGETFLVKVTGEEGEISAPVTDLGDGGYEVQYLPNIPGDLTIEITLNGLHIKESPFRVHIDGATPEYSSAEGPGITQGGCHVNKPAEFTIIARDSKAQPLTIGGDIFTAQATCEIDGSKVPVYVEDNEDGTYLARYEPTSSGPHSIEIQLRQTPISGVPYSTIVYSATPENSYAEGTGLQDAKAVHCAKFNITAVDVDGNKATSGGEPFKISIQSPATEGSEEINLEGVVIDNKDGTYRAEYTPPEPGNYSLVASLYGVNLPGFPKQLHFRPSADGTKSTVTGTGLKNTAADRPIQISIQANDKDGTARSDGGDDFRVVYEHDSGETVSPTVVDNGDGTYTVEHAVTKPGDYKVHVLLDDGVHVANSPYSVYVKPLPSAKDSYADGKGITSPFDNAPAVFTIHAADENGKHLREGGDIFDVSIRSPEGEYLPTPTVEDIGDGTYKVTYFPEKPGSYDADISINGKSIHGFPSQIRVREGTEGVASTFGSFAFTVVARDKRNDVKTFGGDPFEVIIKGPGEAVGAKAVDNGDGTYTGSYTLVGEGKYFISVILNRREVIGSPFVQKVGAGKRDKSANEHVTTVKTNYD